MNLGGEPERDDSGLPPVDIEVPDDARELDRDVQAYRRELRALRRRQRRMRLHPLLTRDGVVLPLLASFLVLALIAGTLLTVFTAGPGGGLPGTTRPPGSARTSSRPATSPPASSPPASASDSPIATTAGEVPGKAVRIGTTATSLHSLAPVVLALVPAGCDCVTAVRQLVRQAGAAGVPVYLVSAKGQVAAARHLAGQAPGTRYVAEDFTGALYATYRPRGLTAVLAGRDNSVTVAVSLPPNLRLTNQLDALQATRASSPSSAAPSS